MYLAEKNQYLEMCTMSSVDAFFLYSIWVSKYEHGDGSQMFWFPLGWTIYYWS